MCVVVDNDGDNNESLKYTGKWGGGNGQMNLTQWSIEFEIIQWQNIFVDYK